MLTRRGFVAALPGVAAALAFRPALAGTDGRFVHGVASGDPNSTGVLLWTRVTPRVAGTVGVQWSVAVDPEFRTVVQSGTVPTDGDRDYTVKVEVDGLEPGRQYFYRFEALGAVSPVGRTRTLPLGRLDRITLGVCSCSNFPAGFFNAYRSMAELDDVDFVLHLGDYIYEYASDGYASAGAAAMGRESLPRNELLSLQDYRTRHAQYKSDPDLQAVHAAHPFIVAWDDHEIANNAWADGAENHGPGEGNWSDRRDAAVRAYFEWMPIREPSSGSRIEAWRAFELGDLATLIMLETRLSGRTRQADVLQDMVYREKPFDSPGPALPDPQRFRDEVLADPNRRKLSDRQRAFVQEHLAASTAAGKPWQVIGNQALMAQVAAPNLAEGLTPDELAKLPESIRRYVDYTRLGLPLSPDAWDGYDAERRWLCETFRATGASPLVVTGDSHAAWALDVLDPATGQRAAAEFGATSISSPGFTEALGLDHARIEAMLKAANHNLRFSEVGHRGFLTLTLGHEAAEARFHTVSTVTQQHYSSRMIQTTRLRHRRGMAPDWL